MRPLTERGRAQFEDEADTLYDAEDRARGYLRVKSRQNNELHDVGLVTVSIGVALSAQRDYTDPREVIAVANEMKTVAKNQPGSFVAYDRRRPSTSRARARRGDPGLSDHFRARHAGCDLYRAAIRPAVPRGTLRAYPPARWRDSVKFRTGGDPGRAAPVSPRPGGRQPPVDPV
ncbi:hypothetical protein ACFQX7_28490 [Luedemannella flava]